MEQYYLISTKWTYPNSAVFTLWRPDGCGYCWYQSWAGLYSDEQVKKYRDRESEGIVIVPASLIKYAFKAAICGKNIVSLLPNNKKIRTIINIKKSGLQGGMSQLKEGDFVWMSDLKVIGLPR